MRPSLGGPRHLISRRLGQQVVRRSVRRVSPRCRQRRRRRPRPSPGSRRPARAWAGPRRQPIGSVGNECCLPGDVRRQHRHDIPALVGLRVVQACRQPRSRTVQLPRDGIALTDAGRPEALHGPQTAVLLDGPGQLGAVPSTTAGAVPWAYHGPSAPLNSIAGTGSPSSLPGQRSRRRHPPQPRSAALAPRRPVPTPTIREPAAPRTPCGRPGATAQWRRPPSTPAAC